MVLRPYRRYWRTNTMSIGCLYTACSEANSSSGARSVHWISANFSDSGMTAGIMPWIRSSDKEIDKEYLWPCERIRVKWPEFSQLWNFQSANAKVALIYWWGFDPDIIILYQPSKQDMDCLYHFCLLCREPYNHNVLWHSVYSSYYAQCIIDRFYSTAWAINKPDKCLLSGSSVAFAACSVLILILSYLFLLFFRNSSTLRNSLTANIVMLAECWI